MSPELAPALPRRALQVQVERHQQPARAVPGPLERGVPRSAGEGQVEPLAHPLAGLVLRLLQGRALDRARLREQVPNLGLVGLGLPRLLQGPAEALVERRELRGAVEVEQLARERLERGAIRLRQQALVERDLGAEQASVVALLGEGIGVDDLAGWAGTNGYEVLTRLGPRYRRLVVG